MSTTKIITGRVRFSYAHVFEPKAIDGGELKYSVAVLVPKTDTATVAKIEAAIEAAIAEGLASKFSGKRPANLKKPLRDGDLERPDDVAYAGHYFFNATSKTPPGVVDAQLNPILDRAEFYSGCYGRVSVNFYAFNVSGNRGVAAGLNNLQKLGEGERLSGGSSAEEDFGTDTDLL